MTVFLHMLLYRPVLIAGLVFSSRQSSDSGLCSIPPPEGFWVTDSQRIEGAYKNSEKIRQNISNEFKDIFERSCDVLLTPTAPNTAFPIDKEITDPVKMYLNDIFTVPANMAGLPAISIPAGLDDNALPLGLQIIAKPFDENTMFQAAAAIECAANFTAKPRYLGGQ